MVTFRSSPLAAVPLALVVSLASCGTDEPDPAASSAGTTDEAPTDEAPGDDVPADDVPADDVPADDVPADEAPADEAPADEAPTDEVPAADGDGGYGGGADVAATGDGDEVRITGFAFDPTALTTTVGTTVTWTNADATSHTVTADDGSFDEELTAGAGAEVTFDEAGTFTYTCVLHEGMTGEVVVE